MSLLLQAQGLGKRFGAVVAASDINISVNTGERVSLIGSNGAGKTTFVNMITGYMKPDQGRITLDGLDITPLAPRAITRLGVARSFQIPQLYGDLTVACLAEVDATTDSFTLWVYPDTSVQLQFYSTSWDFGDPGSFADLGIRIDRRDGWNLNDAELYKNSVLFTLPDNDVAVDFLMEVAAGNRLFLRAPRFLTIFAGR